MPGCPHGRPTWRSCPHCLGINKIKQAFPHKLAEEDAEAALPDNALNTGITTLPCPKCGSPDTWMSFQADRHGRFERGYEASHGHWCGEGEHFDRGCRRCQYGWCTQDVVKASGGDRA